MDNHQLLIQKLDEFIRKYYKNQALRGAIYSTAFLLVSFLFISIIEYFGHFSTTIRTILFYVFLTANLGILGYFVAIPLLKLFKLGSIISHEQAAQIIGKHFPNVSDKLLNTLQLKQMADQQKDSGRRDVILASINQRIGKLKPVPFSNAIRFGENKRYIKYAAAPLMVLLIISIASPKMVFDSSERLIKHREYYEEQAPFEFNLQNDSLNAIRQEDYTLKLNTSGDVLPQDVYVQVDGNRFKMQRESKAEHRYTLRNLQDDVQLQFEANGYSSQPYQLKVLPQPVLRSYTVELKYPDYIGKSNEKLENVGDLDVPEGTAVHWNFKTRNTKSITMYFQDTVVKPEQAANDQFRFQKTFYQNEQYYLKPSNQHMTSRDSIQHYVSVIPDAYPDIQVEQKQDSNASKRLYFSGEISDDYGLSRLTFNYEYRNSQDTAKLNQDLQAQEISINSGELVDNFYHTWSLNRLNIEPGDELRYYFKVWDNDQVNNPKASRSRAFTFKAPTEEELREQMDSTHKTIQSEMAEAKKESERLQKQLEEQRKKMLNKENLSWEDKQSIRETMKQQQALQKRMEKLRSQYQQSLRQQNDYQQLSEQMKEKYQRMDEMLENSMSEKMKKQLEELEKLLSQDEQNKVRKKLEDLNRENEATSKQLERSMELYKQMALEQKMEQNRKRLEELAKKQQELAEKAKNKEETNQEQGNSEKKEDSEKSDKDAKAENGNSEEKQDQEGKKGDQESSDQSGDKEQEKEESLTEEQKEMNEEFEKMKEAMDEMEELNEQMESPNDLEDTESQEQEISEQMQKALEKLQQQQKEGASQNQQKASDEMKKMSEKMQQMMNSMSQQSIMLNYQKVRQILENLIHLSKEQEELIEGFEEVQGYNPQFVKLAQQQNQMKSEAKMIEDSLMALSKKVMQIKSYVNREIGDINHYMEKTKEQLSNRRIGQVRSSQQYIMTGVNNLALMLSEVMDKMQQQMSQSMKGSQMCQNPKPGQSGKKKGKMGKIQQMQKQIGKKLKESLKKGKQPGRQGANSEDLARMARMQEQIRQRIQELKEQMGDGEASDQLKEAEEMMEENEEDIVNKRITEQTKERQERIKIKLLEAEKAERKQGKKDERESQTADQNLFREQPPALNEYREERERQLELLQTVPPKLNGYYRLKVKEYFKAIQ